MVRAQFAGIEVRCEALPWGQTWPSVEVTVCVAVDLDQRKMYCTTDGQWDSKWAEAPTFDEDLLPAGSRLIGGRSVKVYPAMSIKGETSAPVECRGGGGGEDDDAVDDDPGD
ncbi:hypothetical protein AK812_SmicGene9789 [Symbiodinium microadriaticum]|uniref:Uncharacterized protein n=1 Tax=Symbiodinium microadriaticum TaxID=2951 RepID=A0A1Q9EHK8_SYMMI|nr:hypothetical protein AK812_SmicGene9789 [Symbiodinium microadriaticum]